MKKVRYIVLALVAGVFLHFTAFRLMPYVQYLKWREFGGTKYRDGFNDQLMWDDNSSKAIEGLTISQILKKYPHIINAKELDEGTYKRDVYERQKWINDDYELYWMSPTDYGAGWCIEVVGTNAPRLRLIKG